MLTRLVDRMYQLEPTADEDDQPRPVLVRLTPDAKAAWTTYYDAHADEQADLTGDLSAAWSKLEEYAARLALTIHFIRWAADDPTLASAHLVDVESMTAGIRLTRWFKHEARRVYAMLAETDAERDQRRLVEWIDRKGGSASPREVQAGCRWLRGPGEAETALDGLVKAGRGRWRDVPATARGGRPTRVFELSAASTSTEPADSWGDGEFR